MLGLGTQGHQGQELEGDGSRGLRRQAVFCGGQSWALAAGHGRGGDHAHLSLLSSCFSALGQNSGPHTAHSSFLFFAKLPGLGLNLKSSCLNLQECWDNRLHHHAWFFFFFLSQYLTMLLVLASNFRTSSPLTQPPGGWDYRARHHAWLSTPLLGTEPRACCHPPISPNLF